MCSADIVKPDANNILGDISTGEELPSEPAPLTDNEKKLNEILERVKDIYSLPLRLIKVGNFHPWLNLMIQK